MSTSKTTAKPTPEVTGIILAGGQGSRMGGKDKGWVHYRGKPLIQHVVERLSPQVSHLIISANRHVEDYQSFGYPVVSDRRPGQSPDERYQGPIAGILACLERITTDYAVIVPCDAPLLSPNLASTLLNHAGGHSLVLFRDQARLQPLFGLYHRSLTPSLREYFASGGRKLVAWCETMQPCVIEHGEDETGFTNINTPGELNQLEEGR